MAGKDRIQRWRAVLIAVTDEGGQEAVLWEGEVEGRDEGEAMRAVIAEHWHGSLADMGLAPEVMLARTDGT